VADLKFEKENTGLLLIDPYNDFISEGGKLWDRIKSVAEANDCIPHMLQLLTTARKAGLRVFFAMHHRYRPGDYETGATIQSRRCPPFLQLREIGQIRSERVQRDNPCVSVRSVS